MQNLEELFRKIGVVPVIAIKDADTAVPLAKALVKGGLPAAEVTFRTDAAEESIRRMAAEVPEIYVCAGTVLDPETAERAVKAGARAIISRALRPRHDRLVPLHDVPVIPGTMTPTEVELCMRKGASLREILPRPRRPAACRCSTRSRARTASMHFMPTGGVKPDNLADFLGCKNVVACGGTWIVPGDALANGDFAAIEKLASDAAAQVREIRG